MKILITTQAVDLDHPYLGFFHVWLVEFAKRYETVTVLCLEEGRHELPANVRVVHLGKIKDTRLTMKDRLMIVSRFWNYIVSKRQEYDVVFVHMNPEYVCLGGIFWRLMSKKISLFYTHKAVTLKLRLAERLAHVIFTASAESFRLSSTKLSIVGHGIDVEQFASTPRTKALGTEPIRILHVGRITPIKNCDTLIEAGAILAKEWDKKFEIVFVGRPVNEQDQKYLEKITAMIRAASLHESVKFFGTVVQSQLSEQYAAADCTVNLPPTGGVDKVVLESMAAGVPVFSSNATFAKYFGPWASWLLIQEKNTRSLADGIMKLFRSGDARRIGEDLRHFARTSAGVVEVITKISSILSEK